MRREPTKPMLEPQHTVAREYIAQAVQRFEASLATASRNYWHYSPNDPTLNVFSLRLRTIYKDLKSLTATTLNTHAITFHYIKGNRTWYIGSPVNQPHYNQERIFMARGDKATGFSNWQLVPCTVTESMIPEYKKWRSEQEKKSLEPLGEILGIGYKVSIVFVAESSAICFSITGTSDTVNMGKTITTWADTLQEAYWLGLYKVEVLFKGGVWEGKQAPRWG